MSTAICYDPYVGFHVGRMQLLPDGLLGGVIYHDGQFDDSRMAISLAHVCVEKGGVVLNFRRADTRIYCKWAEGDSKDFVRGWNRGTCPILATGAVELKIRCGRGSSF